MNSPLVALALLLMSLYLANVCQRANSEPENSDRPPPLEKEHWSGPHYTLYTNRGPRLNAKQVYETLLELRAIYAPYSNKETNGRKGKTETLIAVYELDLSKCNKDNFESMKELRSYYNIYHRNIKPYLEQCFEELFDYCVGNHRIVLARNFELYVKEDHHYETLEGLIQTIIQLEPKNAIRCHSSSQLKQIKVSDEHIISATIKFIEDKINSNFEGINDDHAIIFKCYTAKARKKLRESIHKTMDKIILDTCKRWVLSIEPIFLFASMGAKFELDEQEELWVEHSIICQRLLALQLYIEKRIIDDYKSRGTLLEKVRQTKLFKEAKNKLKSCFGGHNLFEVVDYHDVRTPDGILARPLRPKEDKGN